MIKKTFKVTGHLVEAAYTETEVKELFMPLLKRLVELREKKKDRIIVYLAAPPGAGKTTLSLFLEELYKEREFPYTFQSISMDGFHHDNRYLNAHYTQRDGEKILLRQLKGIPESFDLNGLKAKIQELKKEDSVEWPTYDRMLHDVSSETQTVAADIVLIEGNYLLLDKEGWKDLHTFCDLSILIKASIDILKNRLIERKQRGGTTKEEALLHYERTDRVNGELVQAHSTKADMTLTLTPEGRFESKQ